MHSLLSLDIGKKNIHIVEGSFIKGSIMVNKAVTIDVPEGSFRGETISDPEILMDSIKRAIQTHGFNTKEAVVTFDGYGSVIRDVDLPAAKPKEIAEMINNEMVQTYHVTSEKVIQYKNVEKVTGEDGILLDRYRVAAIDREIVEAYHNLLIGLKLKPEAMDININAMDKLLEGEITINDTIINEEGAVLMDFGDELSTIYILSKGKPIFYRQVDSGAGEIEKIVSDQVFESVENIRKMKEEGFNFFGNGEEEQKYFNILRPFFYNLTDEIRKIIGFYTSRPNVGKAERMFLFGGGSNLKGFAEYCESSLGMHTEQITHISKIKFKDPKTPLAPYMNAIGALVRY
ncbi:pilus assembly protein PilM [Parasporobacterium paucivorans]|uniref:Type IV pilus assembly protein PilM n=1 Tax=Parasporobacterium paucivorans DSM 15970 TaxID=1122934 RepID=A0A1M6IQR2_9FIRM|nr:pilus assembly protein PilM [Parasporobacterium paucivorans]SHJ36800.1 Type IV pilus assembly protein PilM [Parasporobacterium paucivorans DSM 15970]